MADELGAEGEYGMTEGERGVLDDGRVRKDVECCIFRS